VKVTYILVAIVVVAAVRVFFRLRQRQRQGRQATSAEQEGTDAPDTVSARRPGGFTTGARLGSVGLVARREILERVRGRIFRVGTIIILLVVAGAILIPKIHSNSTSPPQQVGVVGAPNPALTQVVKYSGKQSQTAVKVVSEPTLASAESAVRSGALDVAIVNGDKIIVDQPVSANSSSDTASLSRSWPLSSVSCTPTSRPDCRCRKSSTSRAPKRCRCRACRATRRRAASSRGRP